MNVEVEKIVNEVLKLNFGREFEVKLILASFLQDGHVLLESVPGSGKTKLAKSISSVFALDYKRIQCTPDLMPTDVTGLNIYDPSTQTFRLKKGPIFTNILLVDEINRANPRSQSSLLEVMGEKQVTIDGESISMMENFFVIATQNPVESTQGTFPLPAAQLDRFMIKIPFAYLAKEVEKEILLNHKNVQKSEYQFTKEKLSDLRNQIQQVEVSDTVLDYLLEIVDKTRCNPNIKVGASTRATIQLVEMAKSWAFLHNRLYVIPDDVKEICPFVLNHRMILNPEAQLFTNSEEVMKEILNEVIVPVFEKEKA